MIEPGLKDYWEQFYAWANSEQGLHHFIHFFWAGWIVYLVKTWTHMNPIAIVFILAFSKEIYDWKIKHEDAEYQMADHIWDICSWMFGAIFWLILTVPIGTWI